MTSTQVLAGTRLSTSTNARDVAASREIERGSRDTRKRACSDLCIFFISTAVTAEKNKPSNNLPTCGIYVQTPQQSSTFCI